MPSIDLHFFFEEVELTQKKLDGVIREGILLSEIVIDLKSGSSSPEWSRSIVASEVFSQKELRGLRQIAGDRQI